MKKEYTITISNNVVIKLLKIFGWPVYIPIVFFQLLRERTSPTLEWWANLSVVVFFVIGIIASFFFGCGTIMALIKGRHRMIFIPGFWFAVAVTWLLGWIDTEFLGGWLD